MKKYKFGKDEEGNDIEYDLEDKDYFLITAINRLTSEIRNGR